MSSGGQNPVPTQVGGGPTRFEQIVDLLKNAVGIGGSALDPETVEHSWRRSKAAGLLAIDKNDERATNQWFPDLATDMIPEYERIFHLVPGPGASEEDRRSAITLEWSRRIRSDSPTITEELEKIDSRLTGQTVPRSQARVSFAGRYFEQLDGGESFGSRKATDYPNFSDDYVEVVLFDIGAATIPTRSHQQTISNVEDQMNRILSAWMDFRVVTGIGFILDQSPLDVTAFDA